MRDAVRLAVGTLSVLPVRVPATVDRVVAGRAMLLAPAVGALLGGCAAAVLAGAQALRPDADLLAAVLALVTLVVLSGALHLDGLADTADGLGSRRDQETMLRIMRQGDVGPFGVVAIVLVLLADLAALTACTTAGIGWPALVVAGAASRVTLPWACRRGVPAARPEGLGATVAATVHPAAALGATVLAAVLAGAVLLPDGSHPLTAAGASATTACAAVAAVVVAVATGLGVVRRARRAFGGITGDVLGAGVELGLTACLVVLALAS